MIKEWLLIVRSSDSKITKLYRINGTVKDVIKTVELLEKEREEQTSWFNSEVEENYFYRTYDHVSYEATAKKVETISLNGMYRFALMYENLDTKLRYEREKRIIEKRGMNIYDYVWSEGKRLAMSNEHLLDVRLIEKEV